MRLFSLAAPTSLGYLVLALAWIWCSDGLVDSLGWSPERVQWAQTHKGFGFVTVTAGLLFLSLRWWENHYRREAQSRMSIQQALIESEARFRQLAGTIEEVFWLTDLDKNQVLYISPAYESIWGRTCASLLTEPRNWLEAIHAEDRPRVLAALPQQALGTFDLTYRILTPAGEVRWIRDRAFPVRDQLGQVFRVAGVACDVTSQHLAAAALQASEERYRQLVDLTPEGIFTQVEGRCVFANPAFRRLLGHEPVGREVIELLHPRFRPIVGQRLKDLARGEAQLQPAECEFLKSDSSVVPTEVLAVPYRQEGREGALVLVRDIAERKRADAERAELEAQLRHAQKMQAVGQLAGGIAHDFNNLLTVISGNLALLDIQDSKNASHLDDIASAAERAAELTRQLLTFSRRRAFQPQSVDLGEAVHTVTRLLRRVLGDHIELETESETGVPPILADPGMVEQVVLNLVVNARDAMPLGGRLILKTHPVLWDGGSAALTGRPGSCACLEVSDNGVGMDEETLRRAWEPFFTTKEVGQGTGLGLATVYGIVEQHGGALEIDSAPERGTTVKVYWPLAPPP